MSGTGPPPRPHLTLVTIGVRDVARAAAFYEAWGLVRAGFESERVAFFDMGGTALALYPASALAKDAGFDGTPDGGRVEAGSDFRSVTLGWNRPSREEVDASIADAVALGATVTKPAAEVFWGGYSGYIADLDGHLWEIAHNPDWPLRDNGAMALPPPLPLPTDAPATSERRPS